MAQQERALRTRNALIESAAVLFTQGGFDVASLSAISARAGVSNGALHFHFASKAALATAVWEAAAQRLRQITTEGWAGGESAETGGVLQVLVDTTHALLRGLRHDVILRAGFDLSGSPEPHAAGEDLRRRWQAWVEGVLAEAARRGELARGVSARDAAHAVVAVTVGFGALGSGNAQWLSRSRLTGFWALLLPRLAAEVALRGLVASGRREGDTGADRTPSSSRVIARSGA